MCPVMIITIYFEADHKKLVSSRGWASTGVLAENAGFFLFTGMLSMQKLASSDSGTTWPFYAMNQECY